MIESGTRVSGDRSVGSASGWVITGDNNVVLSVDGRLQETVHLPAVAAGASKLLFGGSLRAGSPLVGSWLRPDAGVVAVEPRPEVDELTRWCVSGRGPLVRLVRGSGGQGKTHLAGQVCARLAKRGWLAGFVQLPPANWRTVTMADLHQAGAGADRLRRQMRRVPELVAAIHALAALRARALLVIDYAENAGPMVAELLDVIADADAESLVRVLLLARTDRGWFRDLTDDHPMHQRVDPQPLVLGALSTDWEPDHAARVWHRAVEGFLRRAVDDGIPVDPSIAASSTGPGRAFGTTLELYADALLTVLNSAPDADVEVRDAVMGVLRHERRQVSSGLYAAGLNLSDVQRDWALAVIALCAAADMDEAVRVLGRAPVLAGLPEQVRGRLAARLHELYPDPADEELWQAPAPDRLTDTHLLDLARSAPSRKQWCADLAALCGTDDEQGARRTVTVLHRCLTSPGIASDVQARIRAGIAHLIRGFPGTFVPVVTVTDPAGFATELTDAIADPTPLMPIDDVENLDALLHDLGFGTTRVTVAVAVSERLVANTSVGPDSTPQQWNWYAGDLTNLSLRLGEVGRSEEGQAAAEQAVAIRRRLAQTEPTTYLPDLAGSLNSLSIRLGEAGRRWESLTAIEEAVAIRRRLAESGSTSDLAELAGFLNNLSNRLNGVGRRAESLAVIEEAVTVYRRLVDTDPAAHLNGLAMALSNLSIRLGEAGRWPEGLVTIEEAITIYRRLADADPAAHLLALAGTLGNLFVGLGEVGRRQEGLQAIEEAVMLYRRLVDDNPAVYRAGLARALDNLSIGLSEVGRRQESLTASEEVVALYRRLAETDEAAHQLGLARSLADLSIRLAEAGRGDEGLTAGEEAVALFRRLAGTGETARLSGLAQSLNNMAVDLADVGRHEEGLVAIEEAIAIRRRLADTDSAPHLPGLAQSLNNLWDLLVGLNRTEEAVAALEEAVTIRRQLAGTDKAAHLPDLAISLNNLARVLGALGRWDDSLAAVEEAVTIRRGLADTDPGTHRINLVHSLDTLSERLAALGRSDEAEAAAAEADHLASLTS
ncbi:hypothetical protein GCM10010168_21830 [Actinoplanes ianthinogenes]|uniref:Tetratricopeptide repeat protein n=1 Tax=Actinoplanes ianthinogenes TaxID=122358 RepID=A0ABN6CSZ5_9ACTN|nr:tetratricopeptide repeat protein [Actinoplanes ianthinogenes]BCJ47824.1 hypothetical protein Aiant_84810 [Actinoplanes ianthinogenes]GGR04420.1 hypothetical protein GCM10010168_21830 [Actinoplanes ianthinogenes]